MGGCCCHYDDNKEDNGEEKCIIVSNEEHQSPKKEYGSLAAMEDNNEPYYEEPAAPDSYQEKECSDEEAGQSKNALSGEHPSTGDVSQTGIAIQETSETKSTDTKENVSVEWNVSSEPETDDNKSQGDVDKEIDQLVAAAMATEVIYPPSVPQEESSFSPPPEAEPREEPSPQAIQEASSDEDESSDPEASPTKKESLIKRTQKSFKRAKARAASMVTLSPKHNSGEIEKKRRSLQDKKSHHQKSSWDERPTQKDSGKMSREERYPLYTKKDNKEEAKSTSKQTGFLPTKRRTYKPEERMRSHYAKDRVAQLEVERDVRDKLASQRSANDPRKAALERGERLGQLDDATDQMRESSSSFAQVARQLRDEQRSRTSTFPW